MLTGDNPSGRAMRIVSRRTIALLAKALRDSCSIGLARATLHFNWLAATDNLRRFCYLKEAKISAF